jgi:multiple sugar transport system substrate-binding protein
LKRQVLITILAVSIIALVGVLPAAAAKPVQLEFWDMQWGEDVVAGTKALVDEWNAANPDIQVRYEMMGWGNYREKLLAAVQAGKTPDISGGDSGMPFLFEAMGEVLHLDDLVEEWKADGRLADMTPWAHEKWLWKGHYLGITWHIDGRAMYYRKDIFADKGIDAPTTWEDFMTVATKLNDPANDFYGIVVPGKAGSYDTDQFFMTLAYQNDANPVDDKGNLTLDTPQFLEALKFEKALVENAAPKGTPGYAFDELKRLYQQGKAAMVFSGGFLARDLRKEAPEIYENTAVLPVLAGPTGVQRSIGFYNAWHIYKQSKHQQEAKKFLDFLMQPENLMKLHAANGAAWGPVYQSMAADPMYKADPIVAEFARQILEHSVDYYYPTNVGATGLGAWGTGLADFVINPVLVGTKTPEQALKDGQARMAPMFRSR